MAFAETMFAWFVALDQFETGLCDLGFGEFAGVRGDSYDISVELDGVDPAARLNEAQQHFIWDSGFLSAYVNHSDGWETHYSWKGAEFVPVEGWRRRRTAKGFEISQWPKGWGDPATGRNSDWLKSGYIVISETPS